MSSLIEPTLLVAQFELPPQDIELLTFCKSAKFNKLKAWTDELKLTQVLATSAQLYKAVPQVAHLKTDVKTRYDMLECLWPAVQQCVQGLSKEFLQQPLILPEPAQKAAIVAQSMQKNLLDGYTICIKELVNQKKLKNNQLGLLHNALFRACQTLGFFMLRNAQLYTQVPPRFWLRLHSLYQLAEFYELQDKFAQVAIDHNCPTRSVSDNYKKALTLASIRPNQLSQKDIAKVFETLNHWVKSIELHPSATDDANNLYLVNLDQDCGPITKNRFEGNEANRVLELNFQKLVTQVSKLNGYDNPVEANIIGQDSKSFSQEIPAVLREHILRCWSNSAQRFQERRRSEISAQACIGLSDTHFHVCGDTPFAQFINPNEEEAEEGSFLSGGFDQLVSSMSAKKDVDSGKQERRTIFPITLQNVSNGGYCALWKGDLPGKIEAGELVGIREDGRRAWSVGVVRWIRQIRNGSQLGIQILSAQPTPYAAAMRNDLGDYSDFMRAFHISSSTEDSFSRCLITNAAPFQEGARAKLKQDEMEVDIRLNKCVFSTSKIKLFNFETLSSDMDD